MEKENIIFAEKKENEENIMEKEKLLQDGWKGGQTDLKGSKGGPRGPRNKRINIRKKLV